MADWHYILEDTPRGPVGAKGIIDLADRGIIGRNTPIWRRGLKSWVPAGRVKGIRFPPTDRDDMNVDPMHEWDLQPKFSGGVLGIVGAVLIGSVIAFLWPVLIMELLGALTVLALIGLPVILHRIAQREKEPELEEALHQSFPTGHRPGRRSKPEVLPPWRGWNGKRR